MRLLIADDEYIIRKGLVSLDWASVGISEVLVAEDGIRAVELLREKNVEIVLSDIRMPGLDGLQLAEYVKIQNLSTKVILLTGFSDFEYAQSAIRSGVFEYLLKPLNPGELFRSVKSAIQEIERLRYKEQMVNKYEVVKGAANTTEQILYDFQNSNPVVREILLYLAGNYNAELSLNSLSQMFHFSTIHLSRLMKKETGYSFIELLLAIRLMNAAKLLREQRLKVNAVCEQVGFHDQRYFSQAFRRTFGATPLEYRKSAPGQKELTLMEMLTLISEKKQPKTSEEINE